MPVSLLLSPRPLAPSQAPGEGFAGADGGAWGGGGGGLNHQKVASLGQWILPVERTAGRCVGEGV